MLNAVQGKAGSGFAIDYRDEQVIAAWRYIPSLDWGMIVKVDVWDAFAPVAAMRNKALTSLIVCLVLGTGIVYLIVRTITLPITNLTNMAKKVHEGDLSARTQVTSRDEIGDLGKYFNKMAEGLITTNISLEQKVQERTAELESLNDALTKEVAEHKRAEENVRIFSHAVASAYDGILLSDLQGNVTYANDAACTMLGYTIQEMLKQNVIRFTRTADEAKNIIASAVNKGSWSGNILAVKKDTNTFPVILSVSIIKDNAGNPGGTIGIFRDVTEQRQASRYARSLIEASLDPLVTISREGKITDVNEATAHVTGVPREQLIGSDFSRYFTETERAKEGYRLVFSKGALSDYPLTIRHKNGRLTHVLYNASVFKNLDGNVVGVFAAARDVTLQRQAEEALRRRTEELETVLDTIPAYVWIGMDPECRVITGNRAANELLGVASGANVSQSVVAIGQAPYIKQLKEDGSEYQPGELPMQRSIALRQPVLNAMLDFVFPNGRRIYAVGNAVPLFDAQGNPRGSVAAFVDITERNPGWETRLKASDDSLNGLQRILESMGDGLVVADTKGEFIYMNPAAKKILGKELHDVSAYRWSEQYQFYLSDMVTPYTSDELPLSRAIQGELVNAAEIYVKYAKTPDCKWVSVTAGPLRDEKGILKGGIAVFRDITEQKNIEDQIKELTHKHELILNSTSEGIYGLDLEGRTTFVNPSAAKMLGWQAEELIGKRMHAVLHHSKEDGASYPVEDCPIYAAFRNGTFHNVDNEVFWRKDGTCFPVRYTSTPILEYGKIVGAVVTFNDITERRQREIEYGTIISATKDGFWTTDMKGRIVDVNNAYCLMTGYSRSELLSMNIGDVEALEKQEDTVQHIRKIMEKGSDLFESKHRCKDGRIIDTEISVNFAKYDDGHLFAFIRDITERKQLEEKMKRANAMLRCIKKINETLLFSKGEEFLFKKVCEYLLELENIKAVWIGMVQENLDVKPVSYAGCDEGFPESMRINLNAPLSDVNPIGIAIKNRRFVTFDSLVGQWKDEALKRGFGSCVIIPLKYGEDAVGVISVYTDKKSAYGDEEIVFLEEVSSDVTVGIKSLRLERKLENNVRKLQESLNMTIEAISLMGEMRDPYTAGHEKHVAQLACAITKEMGLSEDQIEGIRVSAFLHDIGKIVVPSETLSKPAKLNEYEMGMMKTHALAGFDIVKSIAFPWPVSQAILQHHERLNGSGYPNGLKGEDIAIEARILAVADVVEAMTNHRPYRPALGIDKAMEEITQGKGVLYDARVVDICVRLFTEKGFRFEVQ